MDFVVEDAVVGLATVIGAGAAGLGEEFGEYVAARMLGKIVEVIGNPRRPEAVDETVAFASHCLALKTFNSMSSLSLS